MYRMTVKMLWQHCIYLDSSTRTLQFYNRIKMLPIETIHSLGLARLYLRPFATANFLLHDAKSGEVLETAKQVNGILKALAPVLQCLITEIPYIALLSHKGVSELLGQSFQLLVNLEEFVSTNELTTLPRDEDFNLWARWPKLRRLALSDIGIDGRLPCPYRQDLAKLQHLEVLILTNSAYDNQGFKAFQKALQHNRPLKELSLVLIFDDGSYEGSDEAQESLGKVLRVIEVRSSTIATHIGLSAMIRTRSLDGTLWGIAKQP
jgi:hypothetical protein